MAATVKSSGRKWLYVGGCWLGLLGVVTGLAKMRDRLSAGRVPHPAISSDEWVTVVPPFEVPNLIFGRASSNKILNYEKLEEFAKNLKDSPQFKVVIDGRAASSEEADRQLAADRADVVRGKLAELGLAGGCVLSNRVSKSSQGGVTFDIRSGQKSAGNR